MGYGVVREKLHVARLQPHFQLNVRIRADAIVQVEKTSLCTRELNAVVPLNRAHVFTVVEGLEHAIRIGTGCDLGIRRRPGPVLAASIELERRNQVPAPIV